jgi:mono/diheme cytochrome c family protein
MPGKPNPANRPQLPSEQADFQALFARNCSGCHGVEGKLGPALPLNDPLFLAIVPDKVLLEVISQGRSGTPMPAFAQQRSGSLTEKQIEIIAAGLKENFKPGRTDGATPAYAGDLPAQPSADQVARGEKLFSSVCASCHGQQGQGTSDGSAPGPVNDRALLAVFSDQALRRIIITGRPDLGMPTYAESDGRDSDFKPLTSQQIDDLVALLAHWREQTVRVTRTTGLRKRRYQ